MSVICHVFAAYLLTYRYRYMSSTVIVFIIIPPHYMHSSLSIHPPPRFSPLGHQAGYADYKMKDHAFINTMDKRTSMYELCVTVLSHADIMSTQLDSDQSLKAQQRGGYHYLRPILYLILFATAGVSEDLSMSLGFGRIL